MSFFLKKNNFCCRRTTISIIKLKNISDRDKLLKRLIDSGISLDKYEILEPTLEEIFVEKAGEE